MFLSMTGYANLIKNLEIKLKDGNSSLLQISCDAKTINSRYFEANIKLPSNLSALEIKILSLAKKHLVRGKLYFSLNFINSDSVQDDVQFSMRVAEQYFKIATDLARVFEINEKPSVLEFLKLPGVLNLSRPEIDQNFEEQILKIVEQTIEQLTSTRAAEGQNLKADLNQRLENCNTIISSIQAKNKETLQILQQNVVKHELEVQQNPESPVLSDQLQEARHRLDKTDVNEEIVRFKSHLASCAEIFKSSAAEKGKQLDFICQELVRETNTICAKSQELSMVQFGIAAKVELEKIKEQIQNLV